MIWTCLRYISTGLTYALMGLPAPIAFYLLHREAAKVNRAANNYAEQTERRKAEANKTP
jgi:hypothetical protein